MLDQVLSQLLVVAALVERTIQAVKLVAKYGDRFPGYQQYIDVTLSVLAGAVGCCFFKVDLLAVVGLNVAEAPFVGSLLTGVLAGLGSNVVHLILDVITMWRDEMKNASKA